MRGPCPQSRSARTSLGYVKFREAGAVAAGGASGTAARVGLDNLAALLSVDAALSTLVVNVLGAFLLGLVTAHGMPSLSQVLRSGIGVGFLGAFTTFSAVSLFVATATLSTGLGFLLFQLSVGVLAAWAGWHTGSTLRAKSGVSG